MVHRIFHGSCPGEAITKGGRGAGGAGDSEKLAGVVLGRQLGNITGNALVNLRREVKNGRRAHFKQTQLNIK